MKVRRMDNWMIAKVGEDSVMMSVEKGIYIGLNEVGSRIWDLAASESDVDVICDTLTGEFDVPAETCRTEVMKFLSDLEKNGAVALDPA